MGNEHSGGLEGRQLSPNHNLNANNQQLDKVDRFLPQVQPQVEQQQQQFYTFQENINPAFLCAVQPQLLTEEEMQQKMKREEVLKSIQYVQTEPKKDKTFIEYPRFTLLARKKERLYSKEDALNVFQNGSLDPEVIKMTDKKVQKSTQSLLDITQNDRSKTVIEQLGRISYLEDRIEQLQKEQGNQLFHLKYKHKKALNFQEDYNKLRKEVIIYHSKIADIEGLAKNKDVTKQQEELQEKEEEIKKKQQEIQELNEQVGYWKEKALIDENCIAIITNLKGRAQELKKENDRIKEIVYQNEEYADLRQALEENQSSSKEPDVFQDAEELITQYYESTSYDHAFNNRKQVTKMPAIEAFMQTQIIGSSQQKQNQQPFDIKSFLKTIKKKDEKFNQ